MDIMICGMNKNGKSLNQQHTVNGYKILNNYWDKSNTSLIR